MRQSQKDVFRRDLFCSVPLTWKGASSFTDQADRPCVVRFLLTFPISAQSETVSPDSQLGQARLFPALGSLHLSSPCLEQSSCSLMLAWLSVTSLERYSSPPCENQVHLLTLLFSVPSLSPLQHKRLLRIIIISYCVLLFVVACWLACEESKNDLISLVFCCVFNGHTVFP